jgi:hypothetical protein
MHEKKEQNKSKQASKKVSKAESKHTLLEASYLPKLQHYTKLQDPTRRQKGGRSSDTGQTTAYDIDAQCSIKDSLEMLLVSCGCDSQEDTSGCLHLIKKNHLPAISTIFNNFNNFNVLTATNEILFYNCNPECYTSSF